jgi:hypothetical protein
MFQPEQGDRHRQSHQEVTTEQMLALGWVKMPEPAAG